MSSKSIHVATNGIISFFLWLSNIPLWASLVTQMVKNLPAMRETWFWSLGWQDPLARAWQPTPVFLPREFPWIEEPGGLQSTGSQRVRHDWVTKHSTIFLCIFIISFNLKAALHWWASLLSPFIHREIEVFGDTANGNRVDAWTWHFRLLCWVLCASPETVIVSIILCLVAHSLNKHEHLGGSAWSTPPHPLPSSSLFRSSDHSAHAVTMPARLASQLFL